jgi:energy-converting hydrogenase Eha subunit G
VSPTRLIVLVLALPPGAEELVLADFTAGVVQASGWAWEFFSDRVMGGRSGLDQPVVLGSGSDRALPLAGAVNTKGGGFIQVRIRRTQGVLDASEWKGIEATVVRVRRSERGEKDDLPRTHPERGPGGG